MTTKTITQLPAASSLTGTELIESVQGGSSVKTTAQAIANLAPSGQASILVESGSSKKISAMSAAPSLSGTEILPIVQSGATVSTTTQAIANLAPTPSHMTIYTQSGTTYTFVLGDAENYTQFTNSSAVTATVPNNSTVAFPIGTAINLEQNGAGAVTLSPAGGVTLRSKGNLLTSNGQYSVVSIVKVATNTWTVFGNLT